MYKDCEKQNTCIDCGPNTAPVMPPQNTQNCPQPLPCSKYTNTECIKYVGDDIVCVFEGEAIVIPKNTTLDTALADLVSFFCTKVNYLNVHQLITENANDFSTGDDIINNDINYKQDGRHILIANEDNDLTITCQGNTTATYQMLGTGTVTFVAEAGQTLIAPNGDQITSQYGTATLSYNGTTNILLVNNV